MALSVELKHLSILKEINVSTPAFEKEYFAPGATKCFFCDVYFNKYILQKADEIIPAFRGTITSLLFSRNMNIHEVYVETGERNAFSINEALAIKKFLISHQLNGGSGFLDTMYPNIINVYLDINIVASANIQWLPSLKWRLRALRRGNIWPRGARMFVKSELLRSSH